MSVASQDSGDLQLHVAGTDDAGGAQPYCHLQWTLDHGGDRKLSVLAVDYAAQAVSDGRELLVRSATVPFSGVQPGARAQWQSSAVEGALCADVRLTVKRMTCVPRKLCEGVRLDASGVSGIGQSEH